MRPGLLLPLYAGVMVLLLIASMLLVDPATPTSFILILILAYSAFIAFYLYTQWGRSPASDVHRLTDFNSMIETRPANVVAFEKTAESILREIRAKNNDSMGKFTVGSHMPSRYSRTKSLNEISRPDGDSTFDLFASSGIVTWKQHYREAVQAVQENIHCAETEGEKRAFSQALSRIGFNLKNEGEALEIGRQFMVDRAKRYFQGIEPIVDELNNLVMRNFGLSLIKFESTRPNEINLEELSSSLKTYFQSGLLPKRLQPRLSPPQMEKDLIRMTVIMNRIAPLVTYPHGTFLPLLLLEILRQEFNTLQIELNKKPSRSCYNLIMQMDFQMSWDEVPQFRSGNCSKLVVILVGLLAKQDRLENRIVRTFRAFLN